MISISVEKIDYTFQFRTANKRVINLARELYEKAGIKYQAELNSVDYSQHKKVYDVYVIRSRFTEAQDIYKEHLKRLQ